MRHQFQIATTISITQYYNIRQAAFFAIHSANLPFNVSEMSVKIPIDRDGINAQYLCVYMVMTCIIRQ